MGGSLQAGFWMGSLRLLLVEGDALLRRSLKEGCLLESAAVEVVGEAGTAGEGIAAARDLLPDVVLMNLRLPDMRGLEGSRLLTAELPGIRVILLGQEDGEEYQQEALRHGACAYLPYWVPLEALLAAVKSCCWTC